MWAGLNPHGVHRRVPMSTQHIMADIILFSLPLVAGMTTAEGSGSPPIIPKGVAVVVAVAGDKAVLADNPWEQERVKEEGLRHGVMCPRALV